MSSAPVRWSSRWHVRAVVLVVLELEITMSSFRGRSSEPPRSVLNETVQQTLADLTAVDQQPTMRRWTTFTAMQTASDLRIVHRPGTRRSRQVAASVLDELAQSGAIRWVRPGIGVQELVLDHGAELMLARTDFPIRS